MIDLLIALFMAVYPFQCIPELSELHHIDGQDTYVDTSATTGFWLLPDDIIRTYNFVPSNDEYEIIAAYSQSTDMYYVFVFDGLFAIDNVHTCGQAEITPDQYIEIVQHLEHIKWGGD